MLILAIETSCDETCAAVLQDGRMVLSNIISSQIGLHRKTGGVIPEVAAREHLKNIIPVVDKALAEAKVTMNDIEVIAVTEKPGLIGCLLVGLNTAQALAWVYGKKLIMVNHIYGHVFANWLVEKKEKSLPSTTIGGKKKNIKLDMDDFEFPIVVLSVSGGHNDIILMKNYQNIEIIGKTLDDAAGEAFDKVARMIGLDYPGGPSIQKVAGKGNKYAFDFPKSMSKSKDFNFSFSGLKTSVLYKIKDLTAHSSQLTAQLQADLAASFQETVCDILITKLLKAAEKYRAKEIHLTGGVSANLRLRKFLLERTKNKNFKIRYPHNITFCTDNAAMIGAAGKFYDHFEGSSDF
ncbi:MAG: hypothetical protein UR28_C0045G0005 [Candidatus Peregrinibacteria bacterium GW2011_GWF2_33_10]|nr:MAG: hypothetical protein UR28_C0045G0005 [Candidatus Peregrinibacteria bacterium GW2011_GWF2_33_10]OGJ45084.1 MAG: tRNA (adenosine(37)-N6)-threonylcarbamoyltransferase complex transferase subunit TsaD [Candidatus Peregrinibacteria bacterium RIFOXYA2_FULL_33_21]OGJ45490.1 MAG: tRNA (adenosine(37)-N6)-threonylcarbamoyltransferase complex transferase subunit TsaD [Candidatus Peregrinibacteria bacterium RIFOXYA12_FULL_33_12]OGJ50749.1 MAG: tRNA (adenosine(37)-N6)-threonylcarbamoyltransferase com